MSSIYIFAQKLECTVKLKLSVKIIKNIYFCQLHAFPPYGTLCMTSTTLEILSKFLLLQ